MKNNLPFKKPPCHRVWSCHRLVFFIPYRGTGWPVGSPTVHHWPAGTFNGKGRQESFRCAKKGMEAQPQRAELVGISWDKLGYLYIEILGKHAWDPNNESQPKIKGFVFYKTNGIINSDGWWLGDTWWSYIKWESYQWWHKEISSENPRYIWA